jgi:hypothetical protein
MKPDLYTKSILTIIAGTLIYLAVQNTFAPKVVSATGEQSVVIAGVWNARSSSVTRFGPNGVPVSIMFPLEGQPGVSANIRTSK